jgi:hypothetical protein
MAVTGLARRLGQFEAHAAAEASAGQVVVRHRAIVPYGSPASLYE